MDEKNTFENLDDELKNKLKACKSKEEVDALLKDYGGELGDEIVEHVSGGYDWLEDPECRRLGCVFGADCPGMR